jgi:hypothetical protein
MSVGTVKSREGPRVRKQVGVSPTVKPTFAGSEFPVKGVLGNTVNRKRRTSAARP